MSDYETKLMVSFIKPNYNIVLTNERGKIGELDFNGPEMVFRGEAEESAKIFFDYIAKSFSGRLEEERKKTEAELEAYRKDAERYRWIRQANSSEVEGMLWRTESNEAMDAEIDAAIEAGREDATSRKPE